MKKFNKTKKLKNEINEKIKEKETPWILQKSPKKFETFRILERRETLKILENMKNGKRTNCEEYRVR